ncbi:hypothetical protein O6H91_21G004700 [Diphasiastrum complanatum]|uniref:Uncharacterized protein n=1 Tax=Diphasiastrum complanatum TaxID=34168 RepID=A0ACC2AHA9_DIPCM|nr:hypothetical protein O6H91_21G004700 [Diphasiastrum complanatum]
MEDRQTEVRDAAVKAIMLVICPHSLDCNMTILGLVNEFVAVASLNAEGDNTYNKKLTGISDFDSFPEAKALIAGLTGAVRLQLLPVVSYEKGRMCSEHDINRVPLIVAAASAALEKSKRTSNRSLSVSLDALLRSLSLSGYSEPLLAMLQSDGPSCTGSSIAEYYRKASTIEHETLKPLEKLPKVVVFNGLSLALEGLGSNNYFPKNFSETSLKLYGLAQKEFEALQYIVEVLQIPSHLTNRYRDELDGETFIVCAYPLLHMAKNIMSYPLWLSLENQDKSKLVEQLILCCAAFASADKLDEALWTTKELQEMAISVASCLSKALHCTRKIDSLNVSVNNIHDLVLPYIPAIVPQLRQRIKDSLANEENLYMLPSSSSFKDAIVSAHQMHWIIKQVKHPHLGPHIDIVLPCVLTALDHPSPLIKRQAMKTFICLAETLNPSELKWYKDVILDAVCRSLIGSDELWEVAVQMGVSLATCIEGRNPRSFWYRRVFDNMLGELERHSEDQQRRILWLQTIGPLLESMGLVLVVHFKRLLPLLFYWLHLSDDATCILVLSIIKIIIKHTWPRIPFHTSRILEEVIHAYKSSKTSKNGAHIHALAVDVCKLLQRSGKHQFQAAWEKYQNDLGMEPLVSALKSFNENVKAEADK